MKKLKFDMDWDALFPGKPFKVQNMTHYVKPLTISGIASITKKIKGVLPTLKENGFDLQNLELIEEKNVAEFVVKIIPILMDVAPEIISDATGIEVDSLMQFPPQYLVELVKIAIEANLESKESLEKNFKSLTGVFKKKKEKSEE